MNTRQHQASITIKTTPEKLFEALITPSQIKEWWGASRVIVIAEPNGSWAAAWGDNEDNPDYVTVSTIMAFERPKRIEMSDFKYYAKDGKLPFDSTLIRTEYLIESKNGEVILTVHQTGFPLDPAADEFFKGCGIGWERTLAAIKEFLEG